MGEEGLNKVKQSIKDAIIELYYWQYDYTDSFTNLLFTLIHKADPSNRRLLRSAFPNEVAAFELWYHFEGLTQMDFFIREIPEFLESRKGANENI